MNKKNVPLNVVVTGSSPAINHIITDIINRSNMDFTAVISDSADIAMSECGCVVISEYILSNDFAIPDTIRDKPVILVTGNKEALERPSAFGAYKVIKNADGGIEGLERFKKALLCSLDEIRTKPQKSHEKPKAIKPEKVKEVLPHAETTEKAEAVKPAPQVTTPKNITTKIPADIKERDIKLIAIGASTGGTDAIIEVVQNLPADTPPVVIVQHMPEGFTKMYSERLNRICIMDAKEAEDGDRLRKGLIILAHGAKQMRVYKDALGYYIKSEFGEKVSGHCPSVDVLFDSVSKIAGEEALGVILTGMGRDGARGMKAMHDAGSFTIGQNKETCVVYGMPAVAYDEGGVSIQAPLDEIGDIIIQITK